MNITTRSEKTITELASMYHWLNSEGKRSIAKLVKDAAELIREQANENASLSKLLQGEVLKRMEQGIGRRKDWSKRCPARAGNNRVRVKKKGAVA